MRFELLASLAATPVLLAAAPGMALAQSSSFSTDAAALLAAAYPADGPGAAVVMMRGGQLLFSGARGLSNLEARRPITPDTVFRLGSITKQFVAATVLQLVAEGKLSLDDPLSRFMPDYPAPGANATVRQLLNHSSGLFDFSKIPGWMGSEASLRPNSTADLVALTRSRPANAEPGTRWEYSNGGYVLLGAVIEQVTGKPWHEVVVERIGVPLGLKTLAYALDGETDAARASGYALQDGVQRPARGVHMSVAHAAGGLVASVADMARWAQALHNGRVVPAPLYREMTSPAALADGSTRPYGFGLRLQRIRGRAAFVHGGAGRGLDTDSVYLPDDALFVAVFANSSTPATDPATLTRKLAALALGDPLPELTRVPADIAAIEPLFGLYSGQGAPRRFFARDGRLYIGRGDEEAEIFAAGEDRFFLPDGLDWFRIRRQPDGAHRFELHRLDAAGLERAARTGPIPPPLAVAPEILRSYVGTYRTEGPVLTVALRTDGRLTVAAGPQVMPLRPVSPTEFRVEDAPMRLVFHTEGGKVDRLTLYRGARELHGRRAPD